mmetsp:Transcript_15628/g.29637  ORF Transcript_15628/g.29637 Transcript_15628/m.29637 type:complete len:238 (-) Transcript_15628:154-867(-)|eukprot:CAMPEP_0201660430 /NCGR_PEP_ID=MMETSP0494-20130426/3073_1 /ASSEMBLY_ACC=CAM_ASM_000839 /TAXON_ID=420259 /ORGANISM="Thalassiosira gravida, Strain GMp14c1" /LENGTH=237 /DNA_ID=CAMNT_0048138299 /DNA_START=14 /DNA_END=727 /DNA_ORIENTATION=+
MGFFDIVGDAANRAKLTGEIALIDRQITTRKKAFGVELYDVIDKQEKQKNNGSGSMLQTPEIFKTIEHEIKEPLEKFSKAIRVLELKKRGVENEVELVGARQYRDVGTPASAGVGKNVAEKAKEAQLFVQIKYLDRQMLIQKEQFGLAVWDMVSEQQWIHEALVDETKNKSGLGIITGTVEGLTKGIRGTVVKTLGAVSSDEREVAACVNKTKEDVKSMMENKQRKERAVADIVGKK